MKLSRSLLLLAVSLVGGCGGGNNSTPPTPAPPVAFQYRFGGPGEETAYSVRQTGDGGFILVGSTTTSGGGQEDVWVVRADPTGVGDWARTFGSSGSDIARSVQQTDDGGYLLSGSTTSFGAGGRDAWLLKLDAAGNESWSKPYGDSLSNEATCARQTSEGGFIFVGITERTRGGPNDAWLVKIDRSNGQLWTRRFGGDVEDRGYFVEQTREGGYILAGTTDSFGAGSTDAWLVKTDPGGTLVWQRTLGKSGEDGAYCVRQTTDGGYVVAGFQTTPITGPKAMWIARTDPGGNELWSKTLSGSAVGEARSVQQTADGGFIVVGYEHAIGTTHDQVRLIKTDGQGTQTWSMTYGGDDDSRGYEVQATSDGGYVIAASITPAGAGSSDGWLIKTLADGSAGK